MLYSQVAGQEEIKESLIKSINNNKVSHCYIFEGPKGMGKYQLALIFAQSLLCLNFLHDPCNTCKSCVKFNSFNHPDLHIINEDEKNIKREEIDDLINSVYRKPYESKRKIYIIKAAESMTIQGANTFLKTLEEPPGDTVMLLLTTNSNLLLDTIVSRCQIIKFKNISKETIMQELEKYITDKQIIELAANYSNGILNKAINIVRGEDNILHQRQEIIKLFDKIINSHSEIIYELENYFDQQKDNIDTIIEIMMVWIRDIVFVNNNMDNLVINKDYLQLLKTHGKNMKKNSDLIEFMQDISDNIRSNVNYKLAVSNMLLKIQEDFK
ncbi:MAG: DNA polymerase III subunit delta' [Tissierellia bacterium]|nr:DNA polymerase III subunit delta' [Tissierellia bacterium]